MLSVVSYWDVMLKAGRASWTWADARVWWLEALGRLAATVLPLGPEHVAAVYGLQQYVFFFFFLAAVCFVNTYFFAQHML